MKKNMYIQPAIEVTAMQMPALCQTSTPVNNDPLSGGDAD
jgi:hypothetical protein